ncbi:amidase family protein [Pseudovibrio exalbescens]|uniref:amidase family protein n=1 Tax=Pseudovibrio exalbescens TaxID=197461 RepID=UPI000C99C6EC|nr:amidase family protein [Pseudovibrio exalbescens]
MTGTTSDESGAFVEQFEIGPYATGALDGLSFSVKDNIDLAGRPTSFGSPSWRDAHPAPLYNAVCVDQLLAEGATCRGKVVADEFTYSLDGESHFYGTPRNARAPDRIPGGSSSGSAASVANGLVDFSLGTDSGGSVRVPASLCGIWGLRPSLHRISEAGVLPFMPSVSTVGVLANSLVALERPAKVLLKSTGRAVPDVSRILYLQDAFNVADKPVADAALNALERISGASGVSLEAVSFAELVGYDAPLSMCNEAALRNLQTIEFESVVGNWIEAHKPELGFVFSMAYGNVKNFDRVKQMKCLALCEKLFEDINAGLPDGTVVCFPSTPVVAPLKGSLTTLEAVQDFYNRTMTITAFSGVGRLPEISAPLLDVGGIPAGLSFAAGHYKDEFLLKAVGKLVR